MTVVEQGAGGYRRRPWATSRDRAAAALVAAACAGVAMPTFPATGSAAGASVGVGGTERVNVDSNGSQAELVGELSFGIPAISASGRFVVFSSLAGNLVSGDTNGTIDVFVRDRRKGRTERVSVATGGADSDGSSLVGGSAISARGRFVAFSSDAADLVAGDTNGRFDVFVRDRRMRLTERVSVAIGGAEGNAASAGPAISAGGRFVAFESLASNLVRNDSNAETDIFVRDRRKRRTERVSVATSGAEADSRSGAPALSANGRYVAFDSGATNLVPGDTNGMGDVFVRDRRMRRTERVSIATGGGEGNFSSFGPALSADGRFVAFVSQAGSLVRGDTNQVIDAFVHDRRTGRTERVSVATDGGQGNGDCFSPSISADGRFVAFVAQASNLVPGDTNGHFDVFVRDRRKGRTERVSVAAVGSQGNGEVAFSTISAEGRHVAFDSESSNLVPGDTNGQPDVFVRTRR